jgi:UDP-N-acetylmuramoyl-tripeptide--D-alanyl-D-alanine ligase
MQLLLNFLKKGLKELEKFKPAIGRGGIIEINNDKYSKLLIIDDSYNSSLASIKAGLEFARIIKSELQKRRLIIAIGDMLELGSKSDEIHLEAIELAINSEPDLILLIGERMNSNSNIAINKIGQKILQFPDSQSAAKEIDKILQSDDLLYVKGSRGIKMENIYQNINILSC